MDDSKELVAVQNGELVGSIPADVTQVFETAGSKIIDLVGDKPLTEQEIAGMDDRARDAALDRQFAINKSLTKYVGRALMISTLSTARLLNYYRGRFERKAVESGQTKRDAAIAFRKFTTDRGIPKSSVTYFDMVLRNADKTALRFGRDADYLVTVAEIRAHVAQSKQELLEAFNLDTLKGKKADEALESREADGYEKPTRNTDKQRTPKLPENGGNLDYVAKDMMPLVIAIAARNPAQAEQIAQALVQAAERIMKKVAENKQQRLPSGKGLNSEHRVVSTDKPSKQKAS